MLSSFKTMPQRRRKILFLSGLLLACALLPNLIEGGTACLMPGKLAAFRCVINRNAGFAHFTRGMNSYTIDALDKATTVYDVPELKELLRDEDRVTAMTAAEVLQKKGEAGKDALGKAFAAAENTGDKPRAALINEYGELHLQVN